jgi:hypothetical protein
MVAFFTTDGHGATRIGLHFDDHGFSRVIVGVKLCAWETRPGWRNAVQPAVCRVSLRRNVRPAFSRPPRSGGCEPSETSVFVEVLKKVLVSVRSRRPARLLGGLAAVRQKTPGCLLWTSFRQSARAPERSTRTMRTPPRARAQNPSDAVTFQIAFEV